MKVAVIDNFDSFVFNLVRYLREIPTVEIIVQRNNAIDYEVLDECDALLLSPGPGIPSEAGQLFEVIDKYYSSKKILGVCLGHQALGEFFGSKLTQSTEPTHGKASEINIHDKSTLFKSLKDEVIVGRYHSWYLENLGDDLISTSSLESGMNMSIKHKNLKIEGVQFHPESILTPDGRHMIENWIKS